MSYFAINYTGNTKTRIPTTTSHKDTCPPTCPLYLKGCYAKYSFLGKFWNELTRGESKEPLSFDELIQKISELPNGQRWRHNQAGDLPHRDGDIDHTSLSKIVKANKRKQGFTYTHHNVLYPALVDQLGGEPQAEYNQRVIKKANDKGFTINLSANDLDEADKLSDLKIAPVVTLLPSDHDMKDTYTAKGIKIKVCPASKPNTDITCAKCDYCARPNRSFIVGFPAHGTAKKAVSKISLKQV